MNSLRLTFLLAALALANLSARAQVVTATEPVTKLGLGFDYSRGDYGFASDTEVYSFPAHFSYEQDRWLFRAIVPYIEIKGPASVVGGSGTLRPTSRSESGLGDIVLSGTYHARPVPGGLNVDLTGRVKLATADEDKGLGTGETDYYAQVDLYQAFDTFIPFATFGYRFLGRSAIYPLKDGLYASAGTSLRVSSTTIVGAAYNWRRRIIDGAQDGSDATFFFAVNPDPTWNLTGYVLTGFNDASPDLGLGALISYRY